VRKRWTLTDKLTALGVLVTLAGLISAFFIPEVRQFLHLEKPTTAANATPISTAPNLNPRVNQDAAKMPSEPKSKPKMAQRSKSSVKGNGNVAGNNIAGDSNIVGNNNQGGPTAIAPNGIAISGGTVINPTVNNNVGTPPLELRWSVSDTQPTEPYAYAKELTVSSNTYYAPAFVAVFCDGEIESAGPAGVSIDVRTGYLTNDKRAWYVRRGSPPVTPGAPLTIRLYANRAFKVLGVQRIVEDAKP
jgi:hypothetical protein